MYQTLSNAPFGEAPVSVCTDVDALRTCTSDIIRHNTWMGIRELR